MKQTLLSMCRAQITERIDQTESAIDDLNAAASSETKSSAGDKYETGREMIGQELDKYLQTLSEARKQLQQIASIDVSVSPTIKAGSLVRTDHGNFFIVTHLNAITVDEQVYIPVSPVSPIATKMMRLSAGDSFNVNGKNYKVLSVH